MKIVLVYKMIHYSVFGIQLIIIALLKVLKIVAKHQRIIAIQHHVTGMKQIKYVKIYLVINFQQKNYVNFILVLIKVR
jgi:hypothetical protein